MLTLKQTQFCSATNSVRIALSRPLEIHTSFKAAVQIARDNNFMGLICSSRLLVSILQITIQLLSNRS